jgi:hypothetical protein
MPRPDDLPTDSLARFPSRLVAELETGATVDTGTAGFTGRFGEALVRAKRRPRLFASERERDRVRAARDGGGGARKYRGAEVCSGLLPKTAQLVAVVAEQVPLRVLQVGSVSVAGFSSMSA